MTEHPLERPECPCGGDHAYQDHPEQAVDALGTFTVRSVFLNPREGHDRRYYVVDLDDDGNVVDAAWVGPRSEVPAWMDRATLTGDARTIVNVGGFIDRGRLVSEHAHLGETQTAALPRDGLDVASEWA